jgi:integrase
MRPAFYMDLALIMGARVGKLLGLRWERVADALVFLETKSGKPRRMPTKLVRIGRALRRTHERRLACQP